MKEPEGSVKLISMFHRIYEVNQWKHRQKKRRWTTRECDVRFPSCT